MRSDNILCNLKRKNVISKNDIAVTAFNFWISLSNQNEFFTFLTTTFGLSSNGSLETDFVVFLKVINLEAWWIDCHQTLKKIKLGSHPNAFWIKCLGNLWWKESKKILSGTHRLKWRHTEGVLCVNSSWDYFRLSTVMRARALRSSASI